jgi:hypothetical protein
MVSVEAPPANNAEALQVGKVLHALRQQPDLILDVISAETPAGSKTTLGAILADSSASHTSQVVHIRCRLQRWQRGLILLFAPWLAHRPDWSFLFTWGWRQAAAKLRHKPDLLYSRSFPPSSTIAALRLAQHFKIPWFLHLSDPWCECTQDANEFTSRWHRRMERQCLERAARISFASPITLKRYQQCYPELQGRMVFDPNSYNEASVNHAPWEPTNRFRVVHTGSFTLNRKPDDLLKSLRFLGPDHPLLHDLELIHAGPVDAHSRRAFRGAGPWLHNLALVEPERAISLQLEADLLLAIDWEFNNARDAQYLLSKLTDYLAIRRPVLLITNENSASWQFVHSQRVGTAVAHQQIEAISQALLHYWQSWRQRQRSCFELPPPSPNYSAEHVADGIARAARLHLQS